MATVSRQSTFWAVFALGLNTFTQDGGKVLGFPAEYSRALRLSPIVCIVDTLGVLSSVAFFCYRSRSFKDGFTLAARHRCLTEDDPAEPRLERTWWFRFSVFAFGALPQAVKVLAMGGIPLTEVWGMAYLVSFLVLEGLDLLQPRQHRDDHTLETDVAVWNRCMMIPARLVVNIQLLCFLPELYLLLEGPDNSCDLSPPPRTFDAGIARDLLVIGAIGLACWVWMILPPLVLYGAYFFVAGPINLLFERTLSPLLGDYVEVSQMCLFLPVATAYLVGLGILLDRLKNPPRCPLREFLIMSREFLLVTAAVPMLLTFFVWVFICHETASKVRLFRKLFGLKRYGRKQDSMPLLFAAGNIVGIICYYMYIYDPSSTYKPPWTQNLG